MSISDHSNLPDVNSVSPKDTILRYGMIGGMVIIIFSLLGNVVGFAKPSAGLLALVGTVLVSVIIYVLIMIFAVRNHRDQELGGFIPFKRAFVVAFLTGLIIALLGTVFNYIYINFIEPDYVSSMVEEMTEMYERMGMSEAQIEQALSQIREAGDPVQNIKNLGIGAIIGAVVSLIVAGIMKRSQEEVA